MINISSASADRPTPLLNVYAAAKVFVEYFSNVSGSSETGRGGWVRPRPYPYYFCQRQNSVADYNSTPSAVVVVVVVVVVV